MSKVLQSAFCNTFGMHLAKICLDNQFFGHFESDRFRQDLLYVAFIQIWNFLSPFHIHLVNTEIQHDFSCINVGILCINILQQTVWVDPDQDRQNVGPD